MVSLASGFPDTEPATRLELESYAESQAPRLAALVEQTYEATRDCPAMNGMRQMADVLAGYRAAGTFDPGRWFFLHCGGRDVGCLLLTDHPEHKQWELVYVGLVTGVRGQGLGIEAVRRAQFLAGQAGINACCWGSTRTTSRRLPFTARRALPPGIGVAFWCA